MQQPQQSISQQHPAGSADGSVPTVTGGLAEYDIQQAIGKGGYAVVYKGKRKSDGLVVAIKRVEIADMPTKKRDRCIKEVHLLQQLNHPHIITMYDAFVDQNQLVIITEWAPGGDLKKLVRRMAEAGRRFDELEIWHYFAQIVDGLRAMHASRIIHRDIKPANVLVCTSGVLKLGDLGLGRKMGPQTVDVMSKVGTPYYCSPEVVKGVKYDFKSDLWSLGCLLYELAMLKSPFEMEGANLYDVFQKISKGDYQPLPADVFSPAMPGAVQQLLAQDPLARPTAEQCWQQVQLVQQQLIAQQQEQQLHRQQQGQQQQQRGALQHSTSSVKQRQDPSADVSIMSEQLLSTLHVIASITSSGHSSSNSNSRSSSKGASAGMTSAGGALGLLQQLHPLFFAQPLSSFGGSSTVMTELKEEKSQQLQLGVAVAVCAWLARLVDKVNAAQLLESGLSYPRSASSSSRSSRTSSNNSNNSNNSNSSSSSDNSSRRRWPYCKDCIRAAEAMAKAAGSLGVQGSEAAAINQLVQGYGRPVCTLLQAIADTVWKQLQLVCRPCSHASDGYQAQQIEELQDDETDMAADIAASAAVAATDSSEDFDQYSHGHQLPPQQQQQELFGQASPCSKQPQQPTVIHTQVDPVAWRAEVERLGPQLARIHLPAGTAEAAAGLGQDWLGHWQTARQLQQQLSELVVQLQAGLPAVQQRVQEDLQRLQQTEARINQDMAVPMGRFIEMRQQVDHVLQQQRRMENAVQAAQQQLHQVSTRMEGVQQQTAERTDQLQGSVLLQRQRTAVGKLREELQHMELRLGLLAHQLVKCKQQNTALQRRGQQKHQLKGER